MNKYKSPAIEICEFKGEDIITASNLLSDWSELANSIATELSDAELSPVYGE